MSAFNAPPAASARTTYIAATTMQDERFAAEERARVDAESKYRASFEGKSEREREGEPPSAGELKVKTAGLPPARATLVRYFAWLDRERAELVRLNKAKDSFFEAIGVPTVVEAELNDIRKSDITLTSSGSEAGRRAD